MSFFDKMKYFSSARPGSKRKSESTEESDDKRKEKSKKYEATRPDRTFQVSWQNNRSWLVYNKEKGVMSCQVCIDFYDSKTSVSSNLKNTNSFLTGCTNFRASTVVDHEHSSAHMKASERLIAKQQSGSQKLNSSAGKALQCLQAAQRHKLAMLFRNVHAVAKQNRPLSDYEWLCKIDVAKGIDIGETYLNRKAALAFLKSISGAEKSSTTEFIKTSKFFSFMMDGSTDISGDEQEAIYVRSAVDGLVTEKFLCIGSPKSTCSEDLYDFCIKCFDESGIDKEKLVGFGSDGASNMVGSKKGLSTLLKERINPEIINIHCLAHRLELSFRDVFKSNKLYEKLMTLLIGLHYFYKKQYKNKSGLLTTIKVLNIKGTLPPKVTGTRWLPHLQRGIKSLFTTYRAYEAHLATLSHNNPKAEGLYKLLLDKHLICFALFLKDLLDPLMRLSLKLQAPETAFADCLLWVETTADMLNELKERESEELKTILGSGPFQGLQLKGPCPKMLYKNTTINQIEEAIKSRFDVDKSVLAATKISNLKKWPASDTVDTFIEFGVEDVETFSKHFQSSLVEANPEFDLEEVVSEWRLLKKILFKRHGTNLHNMTWAELHDRDLPQIMLVIDLMLTLPPTSVTCETTFSQLKLIKTSRRTRLNNDTLNDLLTVKLQSTDISKFDPEPAIDYWLLSSSKRLPTYQRKSEQHIEEEEEEEEEKKEEEEEIVNFLFGNEKDDDDDFSMDFQSEQDNLVNLMNYLRNSD